MIYAIIKEIIKNIRNIARQLLIAIGLIAHTIIKYVNILAFFVGLFSYAEDINEIVTFKRIATGINCILENHRGHTRHFY